MIFDFLVFLLNSCFFLLISSFFLPIFSFPPDFLVFCQFPGFPQISSFPTGFLGFSRFPVSWFSPDFFVFLVFSADFLVFSAFFGHPVSTALRVTTLVSGLDTPWDLAWGPDGYIWVTERKGTISRVDITTGQVTVVGQVGVVGRRGRSLGPRGRG